MILMRLVWMDLREYEVFVHKHVKKAITTTPVGFQECRFDEVVGSPQASRRSLELASTWPQSWLYQWFLHLSCDTGQFSAETYVRMNQGLLILIILTCVFIARLFCGSWLVCLSVAAMLLSRGRLIAANGDISGQMLITAFATLWVLNLGHWLRTGTRRSLLLSWLPLAALLSLETSLWPIAFAQGLCLSLVFVARGGLIRPLLARMRQTQMKERWFAQTVYPDPVGGVDSEAKIIQRFKKVFGWVRPVEWRYRPLARKFQTGSFFRPLEVPFLLWVYHGRRWRRLLGLTWGLGAVVGLGSLGGALTTQVDVVFDSLMPFIWWQLLWARLDLDLYVAAGILVVVLLRGPTEGLTGFWEMVSLFVMILLSGTLGAWLWDSWSFAQISDHQFPLTVLWRSSQFVLWFEPVFLTLALVGLYHLLRGLDRRLFGNETG